MNYASADHVASLAQKVIDDLIDEPDLDALAARVETACRLDPRLASQLVLTLAAWVPQSDTAADRAKRARIVAGARLGVGHTIRTIPSQETTNV